MSVYVVIVGHRRPTARSVCRLARPALLLQPFPMAWRIDEHLLRGEIDNRVRGRVTGRLWFAGRAEPVVLDLAGNAWRDLAGRRLEFVNPAPVPGSLAGFAARQEGTAGDITASRKVKVPDIPLDQIGAYYEARRPWPWHWGNSLYLEWFGARNGRVVIESASYQLTISPEAAWDMTPAEEEQQRAANAAAMAGFMERLESAVAAEQTGDVGPVPTEAEAETMQADADRLTDRVMARIEREGDATDFEKILAEEIERARRERGEPDPTPGQEAERARWIEEMNAAVAGTIEDEAAEAWKHGDGAEAGDGPDEEHPLAARAFALTLRVMRDTEQRGWIPADAGPEHPVAELVADISKAGAKLAGALNGREDWPPPLEFCAHAIVRLKRAAGYLEDAALAAGSCRDDSLVEPEWLEGVMAEVTAIASATDALIAEQRARLQPGSD
jgi:hypothetical protein